MNPEDYNLDAGLDNLADHMKEVAEYSNLVDSWTDYEAISDDESSPVEDALNKTCEFPTENPELEALSSTLNGKISEAIDEYVAGLKKLLNK